MRVVRAYFDGQEIKPIDPIKTRSKAEILLIFPDDLKKDMETTAPDTARMRLRGSGRGENLTRRLLQSRSEDRRFETR
jgi:hypothetical protein